MEASATQQYGTKRLVKLSWPIFVELLLQLLVGNMDQVQLSHFNGTAVAAVGNANQIISVVILVFNVITLASMILISQYRGANNLQGVNVIYTLSIAMNLALSLALAALLLAFAPALMRLLQVPEELMGEAVLYLRITAAALPFQALMLCFSAFLRAGARMKIIMAITGVVNVCNIAGNAVLINGVGPLPRMGAAGAALSSSIFRAVGLVLMAVAFFRNTPGARVSAALLRPFPRAEAKKLLGIGLPAGGESLSYNLSQTSCLVFVNMMGTYAVTTRMYTVMFANCIYMLVSAAGQAAQVLVGYAAGARRYEDANRCTRTTVRTFLPITTALAVVMCLAAKPLFGVFSTDARVIQLGQTLMLIEVWLETSRSLNIIYVRVLQAAGDIRFPVVVGIASQWAVAVGLSYVLGVVCGLGLAGIWIAFATDETVRGIIFVFRWRSGVWKKKTLV